MIKGKELIKYLKGVKWEDIIPKNDSLSSDEWVDFISRYISDKLKEIDILTSSLEFIKTIKDETGSSPDLEDLKKTLEEIWKKNIEN